MQPTAESVALSPTDLSRIAQDLQIRKVQVENVVQLLAEGNTIPFITRYRKERTGGLNEEVLRNIQDRAEEARDLATRKQTILKSIDAQGRLTDPLKDVILAAESSKRLEDLYLPYKPKKRTLASDARDRGLEPLADAVWNRDPAVANLNEVFAGMIDPDKGLNTIDHVHEGVGHLLAEKIAEMADVRAPVRFALWDNAVIVTAKPEGVDEEKAKDYRDYFAFRESVRDIPPHRILAVNRGEKENQLTVHLEWDPVRIRQAAVSNLPLVDHPHRLLLDPIIDDGISRLLLPSLEREIRRELTEAAQQSAVVVFARNLRSLLLQPPLRNKRVLAIDPGMRTGCKLAALDENGNLLDETVVFPHAPQKKRNEAKSKMEKLVRKYQLSVFAIGNGTACRETEELVSELIASIDSRRNGATPPVETPVAETPVVETPVVETPIVEAPAEVVAVETPVEQAAVETPPAEEVPVVEMPTPEAIIAVAGGSVLPMVKMPERRQSAPPEPLPEAPSDLAYVIVNEAGASDYSASPIAREEFPEKDATLRGTISIGRRLQDPLAELVKVDPQHVGVGLYQHDLKAKFLKQTLDAVVESCVNEVGVDLNSASVPLLRHVSGLNAVVAREVAEWRKANGNFTSREQLKSVSGIGETRFIQAAGFLKLPDGADPFDNTWIHPENYAAARKILEELGFTADDLRNKERLAELQAKLPADATEKVKLAARLGLGDATLSDILDALAKPGRDPRDDRAPPVFKKGILQLEDLVPGMELKGTVLNVVPFGAFVDIGLKDTGLIHISQLANRYIKNPYEVVSVGDVVTVWVMKVETDRRRASLTMILPGSERRPEPREQAPREPRQERPVRSAAPQGQGGQGGPGAPRGPRTGPPQQGRGARPGGDRPRRQDNRPTPMQDPVPSPDMPRKPMKPKELPKLSTDALQGKKPLNSFGQLEAFFKAKNPTAPPPEPPTDTPPTES